MTTTPVALPPHSPGNRALLSALAVVLGALYLITRSEASPPFFTAFMGFIGVAYLPGLAAVLWLDRRFGLWASWILPLMLSPIIASGAALLFAFGGLSPEQSVGWVVFVSVLGLAVAPEPRREIEDWEVSVEMPGFLRRRPDRQQVVLLASVVLVLLAAVLFSRPWLGEVGDALFHARVTAEVLGAGIPPEDPYLAGVPLRYFWAYHLYLALLQSATGVALSSLLAGGGLIAAFVVLFAAYRLLQLFAISHHRCLLGTVFFFFGLNGLPLFSRWLLPGPTAWSIPSPVLETGHLATPLHLPPEHTFFLESFLPGGPMALALSCVLLLLISTLATLGEERGRWNAYAFLAAAGLLLFHPGVGLMVLAATVLSLPVIWLTAGLNPFRGSGAEVSSLLLPVALAALVTFPYLGTLAHNGSHEMLRLISLQGDKLLFLAAVLLPGMLLGTGVLGSFLASENPRRQAWTVWTVLMTVVALVVTLPGPRPWVTSAILAHLGFSLSAGVAIPTWWRRFNRTGRAAFTAFLLLILAPGTTAGLLAYASADRPPQMSAAAQEAAEWIRHELPADAILVDGLPDVALAAHRSLLLGPAAHVNHLGYTVGLANQRKLVFALLMTGGPLSPAARDHLLALQRPIYVVHRRPRAEDRPPPHDSLEVFRNEALILYRWRPGDDSAVDDDPQGT